MGEAARQWDRWEEEEACPPAARLASAATTTSTSPSVAAPPDGAAAESVAGECGSAWNVLAEELLSYPPARGRRAGGAPAPRGRAARRPQPIAHAAAARDRHHAEAWLERELVHLRNRADRAYPVAPSLGRAARAARWDDADAFVRPAPAVYVHEIRHADVQHAAASQQTERPQPARATAPRTRGATLPELRGLRRLLPGVATLAVLVGVWLGANALGTLHRPEAVTIAGATQTSRGLVYVARPGDTLWSIAARVVPNGDPRPVVDQLQQQLHGAVLVPGDRLVLP